MGDVAALNPNGAGAIGFAGQAGGAPIGTAGAAGVAGTNVPQAGVAGAAGEAGEAPVTGGAGAAGADPAGMGGDTVAGTMETGGAMETGGTAGDGVDPSTLEHFSFFVTSLEIMRELSGSQDGFGGDLRFGQADGLSGADAICQAAAEQVGFGAKTWRAFLSATDDGSGNPVHAIDRIGEGPWYDRNGRLVAEDKAGLLSGDRPAGDAATVNDLPNEYGEGLMQYGDTHDVLTGSNAQGQLASTDSANTCNDWTSVTAMPVGGGFGMGGFPGGGGEGSTGGLRVGHAWPAGSGMNWIDAHSESSCAAGVNLVQNGPGDGSSVGAGGGWGGFYCFALTP